MKTKTKHSGRIERRPALQHIATLQEARRKAWESACKHDNVPPESKFVVFSDDNPFAPFVDQATANLLAAMCEYRAGGYVGLKIG